MVLFAMLIKSYYILKNTEIVKYLLKFYLKKNSFQGFKRQRVKIVVLSAYRIVLQEKWEPAVKRSANSSRF